MSAAVSTRIRTGDAPLGAAARPAVLLVDDHQSNLTALEALLSALDVEIVRATSGTEALKHILERDFAVVLMDVQMPDLDGFQTTALIRQRDRSRHTPIIFVTAIFTDEASAKKAYALGAIDYLTKPFDGDILKAKVSALAGRYRADVIELQAAALRAKAAEAAREHAARELAEAQNRTKDDFLALLSHELRAPLNAILGWASQLSDDADLPPRIAKGIEAIARNARAQAKLVDDLIDVSQMAAQALALDWATVDLAAIARTAIAGAAEAAERRRIRIELEVAPAAYEARGDARRLEQLVGHLLSNAIKFSPQDGVVRLELSRKGGALQLRVRDSGAGIAPEVLPHIFEAFHQSDSSWTRRHGGLGIGLTMARHLADLHGGTLEAFSAGSGRGSELVVTLPALARDPIATRPDTTATAAAVESDRQAPRARPLDDLRILVVDDDADARELMQVVLVEAGASVASAASAREALAAFASERFDVVLSDLGMPDEDGLSLMRTIRSAHPTSGSALVAVAVSGYGSAGDREQSARAGFDAHLTKPCEGHTLVATLARLTKRDGA